MNDPPTNTPARAATAAPCPRHGTEYRDDCRDCDHHRHPIPYDPPPRLESRLWAEFEDRRFKEVR